MRVKGWSGVSSVRPADNLKGISFSQILSLKINNYLAVLWVHQGNDTEQGPVGLQGTKTFCVPHVFDYRK